MPTFARTLCFGLAIFTSAPALAADAVTEWTVEADRLGEGGANWHTLAIMQRAIHDAINAVHPVYARWSPKRPDEPSAVGASPEAALAGAAMQVLVDLHPTQRNEIMSVFQNALRLLGDAPGVPAGVALGRSIAEATVQRRAQDGYHQPHPFQADATPGRWRPVPPAFQTSNTNQTRPFLFASQSGFAAAPPPALGSARALRDIDEVKRTGGVQSRDRTEAQSEAATFWAYQSSQRGFMLLAVQLLDAAPRPGGLAEHARIMSQLASGLADSAVMVWAEKEEFSYWRPITAIRSGGYGTQADPGWLPLIETPAFPEYPSGHASDCYVGAGILASVFDEEVGPVDYVAQSGVPHGEFAAIGMGQHAQPGGLVEVRRHFPSLEAAARECALSRIWAGAHFRSADDEAERLARTIVIRARSAVPALAGRSSFGTR